MRDNKKIRETAYTHNRNFVTLQIIQIERDYHGGSEDCENAAVSYLFLEYRYITENSRLEK